MHRISSVFLLLICIGILTNANPVRAQPVVIELFTSQGCGDAPPADQLIKRLSESDPDTVILTCHLQHFDRRGWVDTLGQSFCGDRQSDYYRAWNFTTMEAPQFVVNGFYDSNGLDEDALLQEIKTIQTDRKLIKIPVSIHGGNLNITLPETLLEQRADIWVFPFDRHHKVDILAGANEGTTMDYINVAKDMFKLHNWKGKGESVSYPLADIPVHGEGYMVFAQYERLSEIIGVGSVITGAAKTSDQP